MIDADQNVRDEVDIRRRQIAVKAASLVESGDVDFGRRRAHRGIPG